jgi:uroporphyrinogen-III synthase
MSARTASVLAGRRIAVTRAAAQSTELVALLHSRGAEPLACSTIEIVGPADGYAALDSAVRSLPSYAWVAFTSQNAATAFADRVEALGSGIPSTVHLAAVGRATARIVTSRLRAVDFVPTDARAESLATQLEDIVGRRVLIPRGDLASDCLGRILRSRGASVDEVVAYRTVPGAGTRQLADLVRAGVIDAILFMSASSVRYLVDALKGQKPAGSLAPDGPTVVCIGPETARVARELGVTVSAIAAERTSASVVDALEQWFGREGDVTGG